jgi:hypothetical protein
MDQVGTDVVGERRRLPDRRAHSTTFWGALRFRGRRQGFRRAGEERRAYVDRPSPRVTWLLFAVVIASILDVCCTLLFLGNGGGEANPVMAALLSHGHAPFVGVKTAATNLGAWFLAAHQHFPVAYVGLHALAIVYAVLLLIHLALLLV